MDKNHFAAGRHRRLALWMAWLLAWLSLSGCGRLQSVIPGLFEAPQASATPTQAIHPTLPVETPIPSLVPTNTATSSWTLTIWLPAQMAPSMDSLSGAFLQARLSAFDKEHAEFQIETRLKAIDGPGGMLDALTTANTAAPEALPDLLALPRSLLETAALKGLVYPLEDLTSVMSEADWFEYARELATLQSSTFGLPFAGDALLLAYHTDLVPAPPQDWAELLAQGNILAFPALDAQALLTLLQYQASGGNILDEQGRPFLNAELLSGVLNGYQSAAQMGLVPPWVTQLEDEDRAWEAFLSQRSPLVVAWASQYYQQKAMKTENLAATTIPLPEGVITYTLATGWVWATATPQPERRKMAAHLAEFLLDQDFLARWTQAAGYLPPRQGALQAWQDLSARQLAGELVASAHLYPSADVLSSLGPVLQGAVVEVLRGESDPLSAARSAANRIQSP